MPLTWGKDTFETEDNLRKELGHDVEAACMGHREKSYLSLQQ